MAVSRALRRLLRVLNIEEEQSRLALESSIADLRQLERALATTKNRAIGGRRLVVTSAQTGELPDRLAGIEETRAAVRRAEVLAPRISDAEDEVETLRRAFLAKRVECRQAETLIHEAEAAEAVIAARRSQQALDDWYLNRLNSRRSSASARSADSPEGPAESDRSTKTT